ncbi:pyridoxamine 5'-phosphate oxidase family protein [Novosphingobium album (ex Liu et al. 2023)]|uniref:Pyridoxamine 5'-phosphate oxidase family protein n=1 Tax=Novosphingobium album (ex Liu et al. 2023) TaxID=3031130 RepID=A0ABT5WV78_9SPHN|nr:pyridoxamine 5'-phosphate oxidase family protein [Novosphingobium album (ex Liu et al. 2023)]MDE8653808.1 pyridoxamine 5'-phosphate oxidase family protein [Novosphingobium album (ex Liu et al. 2023)]
MPSRRDLIRMSAGEVRAYLAARRRIIVVSNGPGGLPHPVPMNYGLDDDGRIHITSFARSQKVRNLERDPRAALLVESGETYAELKAVIAYAEAEILRDPDEVAHLMRLIRANESLAASIGDAMTAQVRASIAKRVAIRFTPFRYVSWDHAKLEGFY